jgi:hypothetical protein
VLLDRHGVVHALNQLDPLFSIGDRGHLAFKIVMAVSFSLKPEDGGDAKDYLVFTRLAGVRALVLLVVVLVDGEEDIRRRHMPGSDEVDVLVIATGAEVEAACSLGPGPLISRNRDTEGCGVWVASSESRVAGCPADPSF